MSELHCPTCGGPIPDPATAGRPVECPICRAPFPAPHAHVGVAPVIRFTFTCQRCGSALEGNSGLCNKLGRCPTCGAVFTIPGVDRRTGLPTGPAVVADDGELPTPMHAYAAAGAKAPSIRRKESGEMVIACPRCNFEAGVDANVCPRCGLPFTIEGASMVIAGGAGSGADRLATTSFVLGILGIFTFCLPLLGGLAVILGIISLTRTERSVQSRATRQYALAGTICGLASLVAGLAYFARFL